MVTKGVLIRHLLQHGRLCNHATATTDVVLLLLEEHGEGLIPREDSAAHAGAVDVDGGRGECDAVAEENCHNYLHVVFEPSGSG